MQVFASKIVSEEHQAELGWAVALLVVRAVLGFGFTVDLRVVEFDLNLIVVPCSLQIDSTFIVDAGDVMHSHFLGRVVSHNTLKSVLVRSEVATLVALVMAVASDIWVDISTSAVARVGHVVLKLE